MPSGRLDVDPLQRLIVRPLDRQADGEALPCKVNPSLGYVDAADVEAPLAREGDSRLVGDDGDADLDRVIDGHGCLPGSAVGRCRLAWRGSDPPP